jgi:hypothetical protein
MTLVLVMKLSSVHLISIWYLSFAHGARQSNDSQIRTCAMAIFFGGGISLPVGRADLECTQGNRAVRG